MPTKEIRSAYDVYCWCGFLPDWSAASPHDRDWETYLNEKAGDFLAELDNVFSLTGAAISDSSENEFFRTYTNSDFLKYFSVIDDDLHDQRSGDLKIQRDKISLRCSAVTKFLPYKGFYPAERTQELASLLSQSYGSFIEIGGVAGSTSRPMIL